MNNCSQLDEIIVPYQSISISRYIVRYIHFLFSCTNTLKFGLCNVASSTGRNLMINDGRREKKRNRTVRACAYVLHCNARMKRSRNTYDCTYRLSMLFSFSFFLLRLLKILRCRVWDMSPISGGLTWHAAEVAEGVAEGVTEVVCLKIDIPEFEESFWTNNNNNHCILGTARQEPFIHSIHCPIIGGPTGQKRCYRETDPY